MGRTERRGPFLTQCTWVSVRYIFCVLVSAGAGGLRRRSVMDAADYVAGKPADESYVEQELPEWLKESIETMTGIWDIIDAGDEPQFRDLYYADLQSDINVAEVEHIISREQARYLRRKYPRVDPPWQSLQILTVCL